MVSSEIHSPQPSPSADSSTIKVVIIYEDFASGVRAKHFTERLSEELGCSCEFSESLWRSELLEIPVVAADAARDAASCDYLVVSLRGDGALPWATRRWIEAQLDGAAGRRPWVIALLGSEQGKRRVLDGNRHYLRSTCAARGVDFFSLAESQSAEPVTKRQRGQANTLAPDSPASRRALVPRRD